MNQRIGIYAGTFDPIHQGHIAFAQEALRACDLDMVMFLTEATPRGKSMATDVLKRLHMIEEALVEEPQLGVSTIREKQFTITDTLPALHDAFPGADLTFLMGSDIICNSLAHWPELEKLLENFPLAIGMRSQNSEKEVRRILNGIYQDHNLDPRFEIIETSYPDLASSQFRP